MNRRNNIPRYATFLWRLLALIVLYGWMGAAGASTPRGQEKAGADWWSLQPIVRPAPPPVRDTDWMRNPIDAFVLARLEAEGLAPAPPAEPRALIRRMYFDLIGLPPDPAEVERFVSDHAADADAATSALAGRLLASPHYGERWGRHWLDVARYGESDGFEYDKLRPHAWAYRDWVIRALNDDMPYDRFMQWQIAGDVLEPGDADAITATSFLVCGAFDGLKPAGEKMREAMRQDEMEDLVGIVGQTFLGLTVHCARCHDHKFDPISQKEYYRMASALAGVRRGDRDVPPEKRVVERQRRIREVEERLRLMEQPVRDELLAETKTRQTAASANLRPVARWTFDENFEDELGALHGQSHGGARVENGALRLDGKDAYVSTPPLAESLREKTLEAWVKLDDPGQRGGAAISVQNLDGGRFDAIVYGEREPRRWMAGSESFTRTQPFEGQEEDQAGERFVYIAMVYQADGTIAAYRDGRPYGHSYPSGEPASFAAGESQILFGLRHGTGAANGRMLSGWIDRAQLYDRALTAKEIAVSAHIPSISEEQIVGRLTPAQRGTRAAWKSEWEELKALVEGKEKRQVFAVTPQDAPVTHVLVRGSPFQPAEVVSPGGVDSIRGVDASFGLAPDAPEAARRRALAEWIADPDNPLPARVLVNRVWHYHFGQGLVKTPNDFGYSGGEPSHPELLDWLAGEFRDHGWSLKALHGWIVTSATYRQSARHDPAAHARDAGNMLLWRHAPARMEAEVLRDSILQVAGQLNRTMGGPGFHDFDMRLHKGSWVYDPIDPAGAAFNRRSIYRTWARGGDHPLLSAFDCPDPSAAAPVRGVTTTPMGALSLMNNSFVLRMADHFAARLEREAGEEIVARIERAYALAFGRPPAAEEVAMNRAFIEANGLPAFCRVLFNANEFLYVN